MCRTNLPVMISSTAGKRSRSICSVSWSHKQAIAVAAEPITSRHAKARGRVDIAESQNAGGLEITPLYRPASGQATIKLWRLPRHAVHYLDFICTVDTIRVCRTLAQMRRVMLFENSLNGQADPRPRRLVRIMRIISNAVFWTQVPMA